jgi:plastocyanin
MIRLGNVIFFPICLLITVSCPVSQSSSAASDSVVSQKGRQFNPLSISLVKGGALVIVNDDGDLLHHAYVESDSFNFDSGDQKPGTQTRVVFTVPGDFKVLCGIHPKMKLLVHVQ